MSAGSNLRSMPHPGWDLLSPPVGLAVGGCPELGVAVLGGL